MEDQGNALTPGLYDTFVDEALATRLGMLDVDRLQARLGATDAAELPDRVAEVVAGWVREALASVRSDDRRDAAVAMTMRLLAALHDGTAPDDVAASALDPELRRLRAVEPVDPAGVARTIDEPLTPLRDTVLLTNATGEAAIGHEIKAEIASADAIDVVLAFIRWTGVRDLLDPLRGHVEAGKPLRVITTTYTGSTEARALEALTDLGAEVKVSYDNQATRLHAKAWCFRRDSGFSTVFIGSSNLTFSAQVTGKEWNVRASEPRNADLIDAFDRVFATYWADPHFEAFDAREFAEATRRARHDDDVILTPFAIEPYPFQRQILERLEVERGRGRHRNLVVAATGTGKTVVAALDYRSLRRRLPRARLLFVAHRAEILKQSQATFRHVLNDGSFGELWVGGDRPTQWEHVFASIQSLSTGDVQRIDPDQFDIVIVDEFHHAAADTYTALLDQLEPVELVGLTATPERADGLDILEWFDGRMATELRLWDALEQDLLVPFQYYGISDGTNLAVVPWKRGRGYDSAALANVYTADDLWVSKVLEAVRKVVGTPTQMRALGFGVSISHCEFLAERFNRAGITARVVSANTDAKARAAALSALRDGEVNILFSVDVFNEGVDIPSVDVVCLLRPTESATVFLQQLGRGLRHSEGKAVCTVLDFVGSQSKEFRFDLRYRRMLGRSRRELERDIEADFPYLPAGCSMNLDPVAKGIVLDNVRNALPSRWPEQVRELQLLGDVTLSEYLAETGLELDDLYGERTFTEMRRAAGFLPRDEPDDEKKIGRGLGRLLHLDDVERIAAYRELVDRDTPVRATELDERGARQLQGLLLTLLAPRKGEFASLTAAAAALWRNDPLRRELVELLGLLDDQVTHVPRPLGVLGPIPLT
ncbi:MAG TPA: DEAD/DEAH box helicase family protein, partial [Acidimicrobiales bacterium]|nr:DEAD/DEAH box helicase family protein [Acidimicrobiales bacterium]